MSHRGLSFILSPAVFLLLSTHAAAQVEGLPATRLGAVFPAGAAVGKQIEVTISGGDLDDVRQLHFSHAGITAMQKTAAPGPFDKGPQPVPNTFVVNVAANVPPGVYEARVSGKYGMSNPRAFVIDSFSVITEVEPNNTLENATEITLPMIADGRSNVAADVDYYRFTANANQRIIVECRARRIDSRMDPVVSVSDATGRELGNSRNGYADDPLVDFIAPATGEYTIRVSDSLYLGNNDYFYRIRVGVFPHIDFVFPPAGQAGGNRQFTVYGSNLPGGSAAGFFIDNRQIQRLNVTIPLPGGAATETMAMDDFIGPEAAGTDAVAYRLPNSNSVLVGIAQAAPIAEKEPNSDTKQAQQLTAPCEIQGQFYPAYDLDWYQFEAKKDEVYSIDLMSQRLGIDTDPSLVVFQVTKVTKKNEQGEDVEEEQLRRVMIADDSGNLGAGPEFDTRNEDPSYQLKVPADATYRLLVRDAFNAIRADRRHIYRLAIQKDQPDFRLAAVPEHSYSSVLLRKGGAAAIRVVSFRRSGFDGEISVTAAGLPPGVTASTAIIGPGRNSAAIILTAAANAAPANGLVQIVGKAQIGTASVTRTARFGSSLWPSARPNQTTPMARMPSRLTRNLAVSVSEGEAAQTLVTIGDGKVIETSRVGILKIPYTRSGLFKGKINMTVADQPPNTDGKKFAINPNATTGTFQVNLKNNTPVGTYTMYLSGVCENVPYARNPEAAAAAAERKKEVDKINAEQVAAAKAATAAKTAADKLATDTAAAAQAALVKKTAAETALAAAKAATQNAADKAAQAKAAAAKTPGDANLKNAATAAQKASDDAAAKVKAANDALAASQKALDEADAKAKAAVDAKAEIDKKAAEATELAKVAAELKKVTDAETKRLTDGAKVKPIKFVQIASTPVTVKITPAPVTMKATQPATPLKQGEKLEVPVTITRLYGFNAAVTLSAVLPQGVSGLSIPNATIAAGQNAGKLVIAAAANATDGAHELTVRVNIKLNNQDLNVTQPINLNVQKVEPAPAR